ncbi:unnamed protein product [Calypogeia fissa]
MNLLILPRYVSLSNLGTSRTKSHDVYAKEKRRKGPNVVGILGLLQPLADGLKLRTEIGDVQSSNLSSLPAVKHIYGRHP